MPYNVLYLSYGEGPHEAEVRVSILSAWRFGPPAEEKIRFVVYTDRPASFDRLPVLTRVVRPEEWAAWSGPLQYCHRRKICALQTAFREFDGPVVLVDGDTWWLRPPRRLFERIARSCAVMHIREGRIDWVVDPTYRRVEEIVARFNAACVPGATPAIPRSAFMWNAGVIGIHSDDRWALDEVLELTDALCRRSTDVHVLEQLAFSHVLAQNGALTTASDVVFHYWPRPLRAALQANVGVVDAARDTQPPERLAAQFIDGLPRRSLLRVVAIAVWGLLGRLGLDRRWARRNHW